MKIRGLITIFACVALMFGGCSRNSDVRIDGHFAGHAEKIVRLEQTLPGSRTTVDSATLDRRGNFRMTVRLPDGQPTFYTLHFDNDAIPLLLSAGERVTLHSIGDVTYNYTVEGSPESERLRELSTLLSDGVRTINDLRAAIMRSEGNEQLQQAYFDFVRETQRVMREHIAFIISRPSSLSSLHALYQRLPGQQWLFNSDNDIIYYRMVADSTEKYWPQSPYVVALRAEIDAIDNRHGLLSMISERLAGEGDRFPDLYLPDIYGNRHRLSDLTGHVVLLDFWLSSLPASALNNAEMRTLYDEFGARGFEIYQVSLDRSRAEWVLAVQDKRLPWTTVGDMQGVDGQAARLYNVSRIPANFLLDRQGNIVARDIFGDQLAAEIRKLL
ncbi:MAG: TlpA family protein disulfide reductase [Rikenellaceae bacterium]|nr:TlpA family protein disulfide reductase [Rikenellaceae bacterium]MCL2693431.1 TlpA family protein disulfide reductase [Rikenellaceae bacterium]